MRSFSCSYCPEVYHRNDYLRDHVRKVHPDQELPPPLKRGIAVGLNNVQTTPTCTVPCPYCSEVCSEDVGLEEHLSRVHPGQKLSISLGNSFLHKPGTSGDVNSGQATTASKRISLFQCHYCPEVYLRNDRLRDHVRRVHPGQKLPPTLKRQHQADAISESSKTEGSKQGKSSQMNSAVMKKSHWLTQNFKSIEEFEVWKALEEDATTARFVKVRGDRKRLRHTYRQYVCHRSGHYRERISRKRYMKEFGSAKIGGRCPSVMVLKIYEAGDCEVSYHNNHQGHSCDIVQLPLRKSEREYFATLINAGIPFDNILEKYQMGSTTVASGYFVTKKDLRNIAREFGIDKTEELHSDDDINVMAGVDALEDSKLLPKDTDIDAIDHSIDCATVDDNLSNALNVPPHTTSPQHTLEDYHNEVDIVVADIKKFITNNVTGRAVCEGLKHLSSVLSVMSTPCNFPCLPEAREPASKRTMPQHAFGTKGRKVGITPTPAKKVLLMQSLPGEYDVASTSQGNYSDHDNAG